MKKYKPEIIASILLIAYTIVRTVVVAYSITPVSNVDWRVFLAIELVTTVPYVWAMGDIIRRSAKVGSEQSGNRQRRYLAVTVAVLSLLAPYAYLAAYGSLGTTQGIGAFILLLLVFTLPSIVRLCLRIRRRKHKHV